MTDASNARLLSFVERLENLQTDKDRIAADIKDVKAECKSAGFDMKTVNALLKRRKLTDQERDEQDALLETYEHAIQQALPLADVPKVEPRLASRKKIDAISPADMPAVTDADLAGVARAVIKQNVETLEKLTEGPPRSAVAASVDALRTQLRG
jgi:uncharacterized protein (UPF0335 family)